MPAVEDRKLRGRHGMGAGGSARRRVGRSTQTTAAAEPAPARHCSGLLIADRVVGRLQSLSLTPSHPGGVGTLRLGGGGSRGTNHRAQQAINERRKNVRVALTSTLFSTPDVVWTYVRGLNSARRSERPHLRLADLRLSGWRLWLKAMADSLRVADRSRVEVRRSTLRRQGGSIRCARQVSATGVSRQSSDSNRTTRRERSSHACRQWAVIDQRML
jgi:hypothetical protein